MNWILGIDTSSTGLSVGLYRGVEPAASHSLDMRNSHAEHITEAVSHVLSRCGAGPGDITHTAIAAGPGSFTGLRIGFAFAKGFCMYGPVRVLPVSSLFVLAHSAVGRRARSVVAAIDARRGEVFWARFDLTVSGVVRVTEDTACSIAAFREAVGPEDTVVFDRLGYPKSTVFDFLDGHPCAFPVPQHQTDRGLCCAAAGAAAVDDSAAWKDPSKALPAYLRRFTPPGQAVQGGKT